MIQRFLICVTQTFYFDLTSFLICVAFKFFIDVNYLYSLISTYLHHEYDITQNSEAVV